MAGRDAYLELGFHEPVRKPGDSPQAQAAMSPKRTFTSAQAIGQDPSAAIVDHGPVDPPGNEYLVGLIFVAVVLLLGLIGGFFVRGMFETSPTPVQAIDVLSVQSVSDFDALPSNASTDVVYFGSRAADQMLAVQPTLDGYDMLLFAKTHADGDRASASTRLLKYGASNQLDKGHSIQELNVFKGEGIDLIRLSNSALIASIVTEDKVSVMRFNEAGRTLWSKDFATSAAGADDIAIAPAADRVLIMAPHEDVGYFRIASLDADGRMRWETMLARPNPMHKSHIAVDELGQSFAVIGSDPNGPDGNQHSIAMIDSDGRILRQAALPMAASETLLDLSPRPGGGLVAFIAGDVSRLVELDANGTLIGGVDLPLMQFPRDARVLPTETNDVLIASTFALAGNRIDLVLEKRGFDGFVLGQRTLSLPEGSSLDDIVRVSDTEYMVTGSVRRDRYLPTDIFLRRISFNSNFPSVETRASADLAAQWTAQPVEVVAEETFEGEEVVVADTPNDSIPIVASISVSDVAEEDLEPAIEVTESEPEPETVASVEIEAVTQQAGTQETVTQEAAIQDEEIVLVEDQVQDSTTIQCRFTCLDAATNSTFPMSGHFSPEFSLSSVQRTQTHIQICQTAGLIPALVEQPECGVN